VSLIALIRVTLANPWGFAGNESLYYLAFSQGQFTQWLWHFVPHAIALAVRVALVVD